MNALEVDPAGLTTLALRCDSWSTELTVPTTTSTDLDSPQATRAAVNTVAAAAAATANEFAARLRSISARLVDASGRYLTNDEASAAGLAGLEER